MIRPLLAMVLAALSCVASGAGSEPEDPAGKAVSAFRLAEDPRVKHEVPLERVRKGIPVPDPRDRIRSIDSPRFTAVEEAGWLRGDDRVLGVVLGREARWRQSRQSG